MAKGKSQPGGAKVTGGPKSAGSKTKPVTPNKNLGGPKKGK